MASRSPTLTQLSRTLIGPKVMQATGGVDVAGASAADFGAPAGGNDTQDEPLWKKLGFESEQAYLDWVNAPAVSPETQAGPANATSPQVTSGAAAAPASTVTRAQPAVAPESQAATITIPSAGEGTKYTQGLPEIPGTTLPAPTGSFGLADATAGVAGPGEEYTPKPSLLSRAAHAVARAANIAVHQPTGFTATGTGITQGPSLAQMNETASKPAELAGKEIPEVVPGAPGRVIGKGVESVLSPVNLAFTALAPEAAIPKLALSSFLSGAASQGAKEAGAPGVVQTGAGFGAGFLPGVTEAGAKAVASAIKGVAPEDLASQLKDATVQTVAKTIANAKNPQDVIDTVRQLDYAQRMALTLEVGQSDKAKMLELGKLLSAAEAGDMQAAKTLQSGYFKALTRTQRILPLPKNFPGGKMPPISAAVEGGAEGGFTPSNAIERALGRSLSQGEQEYINSLPPDRLQQLLTEAAAPGAATQASQMGVGTASTGGSQLAADLKAGGGLTKRTYGIGFDGPKLDVEFRSMGDQVVATTSDGRQFVGTAQEVSDAAEAAGRDFQKGTASVTTASDRPLAEAAQATSPLNAPTSHVEAAAPGAATQAADMGVGNAAPPPGTEPAAPVTVNPTGTTAPNVTDQALADKAAAAAARAAPESLPLGPSGGGSLDRNLSGIGLDDQAKSIVSKFANDFQAEGATYPTQVSNVRKVTSFLGGDVQDPYLAGLLRNSDQLTAQLAEHQMETLGLNQRVQDLKQIASDLTPEARLTEAQDVQSAINDARKQVDDAVRAFQEDAVNQRYTGAAKNDAMSTLNDVAAKRAAQTSNLLDRAQAQVKELVFGLDVGTVLQNDLTAVRRGGTSIVSGLIGHLADRIRKGLGADPESLGVYFDKSVSPAVQRASDSYIEQGARGAGLNRDLFQNVQAKNLASRAKDTALGALQSFNNAQYNVVERLGRLAYEGQLYQAKALGMDITDPVLRKQAGAFGNLVRSTAADATKPGAARWERRLILSVPMTKAQGSEIAQVFKSASSPMQALNSANLIASTAATFGLAYELSKVIGEPMSFSQFLKTSADPMSTSFGKMTLRAKDDTGKHIVWSYLPQYSLESAVLKSVRALSDAARGNADAKTTLAAIGDAAARYGLGRLNVLPRDATSAAGFGYGFGSGFHYGDMPLKERGENQLPLPTTVTQALSEHTTPAKSPAGFGLNLLGGNSYSESQYSQMERWAQDRYGMSYFDLPPNYQASLNKEAADSGATVDVKTRAAPVEYASNGAFTWVQQQLAKDPAAQQQLQGELDRLGMSGYDIASYKTIGPAHSAFVSQAQKAGASRLQAEKAWTAMRDNFLHVNDVTTQMQRAAVQADPEAAVAELQLYNSGQSQYAPPKWLTDFVDWYEAQQSGAGQATGPR